MSDAHAQWLALLILATLLMATGIYGSRSSVFTEVNRHFAIQTFVMTWWVIGIAGAHSAFASEFWGRWTFTAAALMPATFLTFSQAFPTRDALLPSPIVRVVQFLSFSFAFVALATPWIAHSFVVSGGVITRTPGPLMRAFSVFFLVSSTIVFVGLTKKLRASRGLPRAQLRLYYLGLLLFSVGGTTTNLLLPSIVGDSRYSIVGPCFVLFFVAFVAHGIIRHRFMNVRLVVHNWLTVCVASFVSILPLLAVIAQTPLLDSSPLAQQLVVVAAGLAAPLIWVQTRRLLHRYVHRGDADFQTLVSATSSRLSTMLSVAETATVITDTLAQAFRPDGVAIYTAAHDADRLTLTHYRRTPSPSPSTIGFPSELPAPIEQELVGVDILSSIEFVAGGQSPNTTPVAAAFLRLNHWTLLIPLPGEHGLLGAIAIGQKLSGDPYYLEDISLLRVLSSQAAVAFSNGKLYERVLMATQQIENIVATVQSGILVAYDENTVQVMNEEALRLLQLPLSVRLPAFLQSALLPASIIDLLTRARESHGKVQRAELVELPIMCATAPLRKADGEIVGVVAALNDLSTLRALELERSRAERLNYFEALAAGLAHEIANPLAPIKIMTQLLPSRAQTANFISEFTRTVSREITRMEQLVRRLQSLSSPANRERVPTDICLVVSDAVDTARPLFEEKRVGLTVLQSISPLVVKADANELRELFLNLLLNAVEATPPHGLVSVESTVDDGSVHVQFCDSGSGIPASLLDRVFDPFVSSKERGSGLGLALCHGIVRRHEGTIVASNNEPGASFVVRIPMIATALLPSARGDVPQIEGHRAHSVSTER